MAKKFIILGVVLFLGGAAGLGWLALGNHISQGEAAAEKPESEPVAKQYLKQYKRYFQSTLEEQVDSAPGIDSYVKLKTESQRRQEQQERLNADLQDLAAGEKDNHRSGDLLYGENWKQKVTKYKARKELTELIFSVSSATLLAGLALVIGCFLLRLVSKISSHLKKRTRQDANSPIYPASQTGPERNHPS